MIEEISEKLKNGYYFNNELPEVDMIYIVNTISLRDQLVELLASKRDIKLKFSSYSTDLEKYLFTIIDKYSGEKKINLVTNYITADVGNFIFTVHYIYEISKRLNFSKEEREMLENYLYNYVLDENNKVNFRCDEETVKFLLDNKRYDLLDRFEKTHELSDELQKRLNDEFPFDKYPLPKILTLKNGCYNTDNLTDEDILNGIVKKYEYVNFEDFTNNPKLKEIYLNVLERLSNNENDITNSELRNLFLSSIIHVENLDIINEDILKKLVKKGLFNIDIYNYVIEKKYFEQEELDDLLFYYLDKAEDKIQYMRKYLETGSYGMASSLEDNIKNRLIREGYGLLLLYSLNTCNDLKLLDQLETQVKNGNNKINNFEFIYISIALIKKEYLFDYIINNCKVDSVACSYDMNINNLDENELKKFKQFIINNNISLDGFRYFDEDFFDMYYTKGNCLHISFEYYNLSKEERKKALKWIDSHKDDVLLLKTLLSNQDCNIDIIDIAIDNDILCEYAYEAILNNHILLNSNNEKVINKLIQFCSKKYNLNEKNIKILINSFGPKIFGYLENETIREIINLNEEDLVKLINIFPMNCGLIDIEAAHESLMQFSYKQNERNSEVVNIYNNLNRAIVNNDKELINKYKYILLSYIDINLYENIQEVNPELKEFDLDSALDFIINNISNDKYAKILHELTDNVVSMARKYYISDTYFKKKDEYLSSPLFKIGEMIEICVNGIKRDVTGFVPIELIREYEFFSNKRYIEILDKLYNVLFDTISKEAKEKILEKYNFENISKLKTFILFSDNKDKVKSIINELERVAINCARTNAQGDYSVFAQMGIDYDLDEKSKKNEIEKYIMRELEFSSWNLSNIRDLVVKELGDNGISKELAEKIIVYYYTATCPYTFDGHIAGNKMREKLLLNRSYTDEEKQEIEDIKKYIGLYFKVATKIIREHYNEILKLNPNFEEEVIESLDSSYLIKRKYKVDTSKIDIYRILELLKMDLIKENIIDNPENYSILVKAMSKYKPHLLPSSFSTLIEEEEMPITSDLQDVSAFINYFSEISKMKFSLVNILVQSGIYSSVNSIYSSILGKEDAKLIKSNPVPNAANRKTKNNARLKEAVLDTVIVYKRDTMLIPPIDKLVEVSNSENIRVIVGNFTSPCNLTHGERTEACMRIGGAGEDLFNFCLKNKAGFHIRFENPKTHKYISRVSGFRNGNTIYLNELRHSLGDYRDEDLVMALQKISKELIELTKDSDYPIENVFITDHLAMSSCDENMRQKIESKKITEGLDKIYTNIGDDVVLLATSVKEGYVPLKTGNSGIKEYKVQRSKPIVYTNKALATNRINRIVTVNQLLDGVDISDLRIEQFRDGIIYSVINDDWYIYVTSNLEIKSGFIKGNNEALIELNNYLDIVSDKIQSKEIKEDVYGL